MNRRALILMIAVALLAATSSWLSREAVQPSVEGPNVDRSPNYFLTDFTAIEMDYRGYPRQRLESTRLTHYPVSDTIEVERPSLAVFGEGAPWQLTAEQGLIEDQGRRVNLSGGVRMEREAPQQSELLTSTLRVFPERRYAETDDPVLLRRPGSEMNAVGMEADLNRQQLVLRSNVRGNYAP